MSYQKLQYENDVLKSVKAINNDTINDNDITNILKYLNCALEMYDYIKDRDLKIIGLWNNIIADIIGAIHSATSGFYRTALISLRSILELACNSLYYLDHGIELYLFKNHDAPADKYVSSLVNNHKFYTSNYISSFYKNISIDQVNPDSVSDELKRIYKDLCDIVHGRFKSLTKKNALEIKYDKQSFKNFEIKFIKTLSLISTMFILRFDYKTSKDMIELSLINKVVNFDVN